MILRDGVLAGTTVVVAGHGELARAVADLCAELGAGVVDHAVDPDGDEPAAPAVDGERPVVVWDGDGAFAAAEEGVARVRAALDGAWLAVRPVAASSMIDGAGGKVVLVAPRAAGPEGEAARAGLENLARTLGIEWARHAIRTVAIVPSAATAPADVADLVAYLASPAGDYFSGCALTLGAAA